MFYANKNDPTITFTHHDVLMSIYITYRLGKTLKCKFSLMTCLTRLVLRRLFVPRSGSWAPVSHLPRGTTCSASIGKGAAQGAFPIRNPNLATATWGIESRD